MNRVIIEVLPTLWSPKNTSLYFAKGANEELLLERIGVDLAGPEVATGAVLVVGVFAVDSLILAGVAVVVMVALFQVEIFRQSFARVFQFYSCFLYGYLLIIIHTKLKNSRMV